MKSKLVIPGLALILSALIISGCGSSNNEAAQTPAVTEQVAPATTVAQVTPEAATKTPTVTEQAPPTPTVAQAEPEAAADWPTFQNEKHGYSFKYPLDCFYGPLPADCKAKPPEERPLECLCFLNGENLDQVSLQAFTGEKDNLSLAEFSISHYSSPQYNPPPGTDLVEWLQEEFSDMYPDIPNEPNVEIGEILAVRICRPGSPSAPSVEGIYFIKEDKLFQIQMLEPDNKDNKELYDQMLSTLEIAVGASTGG